MSFGDTLRHLAVFNGTRAAVKRRGLQRDVRLIANVSSAHCLQALSHAALGSANAKALARDDRVSKELASVSRHVLINTKDVPLTDGYKRNLRHEGHNLNVMFGSLIIFATFNFADSYAPLLFNLRIGSEVVSMCDSQLAFGLTCARPQQAPIGGVCWLVIAEGAMILRPGRVRHSALQAKYMAQSERGFVSTLVPTWHSSIPANYLESNCLVFLTAARPTYVGPHLRIWPP